MLRSKLETQLQNICNWNDVLRKWISHREIDIELSYPRYHLRLLRLDYYSRAYRQRVQPRLFLSSPLLFHDPVALLPLSRLLCPGIKRDTRYTIGSRKRKLIARRQAAVCFIKPSAVKMWADDEIVGRLLLAEYLSSWRSQMDLMGCNNWRQLVSTFFDPPPL